MKIDLWNRRSFLNATGAFTLTGTAPALHAAEPAPETTHIRIVHFAVSCQANVYVAEALLKAEGFTDVQYVAADNLMGEQVADGRADFVQNDAAAFMLGLDAGLPLVVVAGIHSGCWELIAQKSIRSVRDLKGKTVAAVPRSSHRAFVTVMTGAAGLDPNKDIVWHEHAMYDSMRKFEQGTIDAFMGFAPEPQILRSKNLGHTLLSTLTDPPWSQYFCCLMGTNRDFLRKNPVATKRALRALMKASDLCASQPELATRTLMARSGGKDFEFTLRSVKDIGYRKWRDYSAEDTMRYWGLRLREYGMIKSDPKKLLAQGTDWRYFDHLKKEMKT